MLGTAILEKLPVIEILIVSTLMFNCFGMEDMPLMNATEARNNSTAEEILSRSRRYLLWNPLSVVQITVALAVPMRDVQEKSKNVGVAFDIQGNYPLPTRVEQLEPGYIPVAPGSRRMARDLSLQDTYKSFEEILYAQGFDGRACLLQSICMAAEAPMLRDNLFEEIMHLFLTPTEIMSDISTHYMEAQKLGESGANCREAFPDCRTPILDVISRIWHSSSQTNDESAAPAFAEATEKRKRSKPRDR